MMLTNGQTVNVTDSRGNIRFNGTVLVWDKSPLVLVELNREYAWAHDGDGSGKPNRCWWFNKRSILPAFMENV